MRNQLPLTLLGIEAKEVYPRAVCASTMSKETSDQANNGADQAKHRRFDGQLPDESLG